MLSGSLIALGAVAWIAVLVAAVLLWRVWAGTLLGGPWHGRLRKFACEPALMPVPVIGAAGGLRVLLVDDVSMNLQIASSFLALAGHWPICVDNGQAALEAAALSEFDVILMDVRMPGLDGLEATRRIRALPPPRSRVPIVAMTAQTFADEVEKCRVAGMDGHLSKPVERDALLEAVMRAAAAPPDGRDGGQRMPGDPEPSDLQETIYRQMLDLLKPEEVDRRLHRLGTAAERFCAELRAPAGKLVDAGLLQRARRLGGSAGLFGFQRLLERQRTPVQRARRIAGRRAAAWVGQLRSIA